MTQKEVLDYAMEIINDPDQLRVATMVLGAISGLVVGGVAGWKVLYGLGRAGWWTATKGWDLVRWMFRPAELRPFARAILDVLQRGDLIVDGGRIVGDHLTLTPSLKSDAALEIDNRVEGHNLNRRERRVVSRAAQKTYATLAAKAAAVEQVRLAKVVAPPTPACIKCTGVPCRCAECRGLRGGLDNGPGPGRVRMIEKRS